MPKIEVLLITETYYRRTFDADSLEHGLQLVRRLDLDREMQTSNVATEWKREFTDESGPDFVEVVEVIEKETGRRYVLHENDGLLLSEAPPPYSPSAPPSFFEGKQWVVARRKSDTAK